MTRWKPPIPPKAAAMMPAEPFERWLAEQALGGHDKHWLRRNAAALRERWARDPHTNLPPPAPQPERPARSRYEEL